MSGSRKSAPRELSRARRRTDHPCWNHLIVAPLWVAYRVNLGTLLRTCDAVGACMAVPRTPHYREALAHGNTLPGRSCVHWVGPTQAAWLAAQRRDGTRIVAVELGEGAVRLAALAPARGRTVVLLGHERDGVPEEVWDLLDEVVEIPMLGRGASLNVAVAGSLVLYKLAGLT
ncbi:MAG: TrmH family RNA methyltransferase [Sporichthyaceae bacterium]